MEIKDVIKELRKQMTQRELAIALDVAEKTISLWEGSTTEPQGKNIDKILALAKEKGVGEPPC